MPNLTVRYFAIFREQAGTECERLSTTADSPRQLYEELLRMHPFTIPPQALRVAVNKEFGSMDQPLREHDEVAFIAPVAGG